MLLDIEQIKQSIKHLSPAELAELGQFIQQEQEPTMIRPQMSRAERVAGLEAAIENFWEGFTLEEVDEIIADINRKIITPEDPELFAWLDKELA